VAGIEHASYLAVEILNASRRWVASRAVLRRVLDSKTATEPQLAKAKAGYNKTAEELEALVVRLEKFLQTTGKKVSLKKNSAGLGQSSPFPWKELIGLVATGAKAVEQALGDTPKVVQAKVVSARPIIDVEGE
jgi:hypothetical protein